MPLPSTPTIAFSAFRYCRAFDGVVLVGQLMAHLLLDLASQSLELGGANEANRATFVPLDARVQARDTLMSGLRFTDPDQAAAVDALSRHLGITPEEVLARLGMGKDPVLPPLPGESEFERRERLRGERKRLVGILHHRSGRDYQEIQQWVNEVVASGRSITEHTVPELEHAVRLLTQELSVRRSGAGVPSGVVVS
jgi:hypothetical protein